MALLGEKAVCIAAYGPGNPTLEHTVNENIGTGEYQMGIEVYKRVLALLLRELR